MHEGRLRAITTEPKEIKKDLTQDQLEGVLEDQFETAMSWEWLILLCLMGVPFLVMVVGNLNFAALPLLFKLVYWVVTYIAYVKWKEWAVNRRVRKTIEAIRAM